MVEALFPQAVLDMSQRLTEAGATPLDSAFRVGGSGRQELIYQGRRLLVTSNNESYADYVAAMQAAELTYVANDPLLGSEQVVVGEIPRDARTLPQIIFSRQSEGGFTSKDVLYMAGRAVHRVADVGYMPAAEDISLQGIMVVRDQPRILLVPPLALTQNTEEAGRALTQRMHDQLLPAYERFGGIVLLEAFQEGLHGG